MAKTKIKYRYRSQKTKRRKPKQKLSVATVAGVAAGIFRQAPAGRTIIDDLRSGDVNALAYDAREIFTGIDQNGAFRWDWVAATYAPMVAGALVSKYVGGKMGINRQLAKVPFIKL